MNEQERLEAVALSLIPSFDSDKQARIKGYLGCAEHYLKLAIKDPSSKRSDGTTNVKLAFQFAQSAYVLNG